MSHESLKRFSKTRISLFKTILETSGAVSTNTKESRIIKASWVDKTSTKQWTIKVYIKLDFSRMISWLSWEHKRKLRNKINLFRTLPSIFISFSVSETLYLKHKYYTILIEENYATDSNIIIYHDLNLEK